MSACNSYRAREVCCELVTDNAKKPVTARATFATKATTNVPERPKASTPRFTSEFPTKPSTSRPQTLPTALPVPQTIKIKPTQYARLTTKQPTTPSTWSQTLSTAVPLSKPNRIVPILPSTNENSYSLHPNYKKFEKLKCGSATGDRVANGDKQSQLF